MSKSRSTAVAVPFLLVMFASGCSGTSAEADGQIVLSPSPVSSPSPSAVSPPPPPSPSPLPSAGARDRLFTLGGAWFETQATVNYRTVGAVEGQPMSTHQCLRQMVSERDDIPMGLRMCSRQGRLRLTWDPPGRWRMDVATPLERFTLISAHGRTQICPNGGPPACRRILTADAIAEAGTDVFFQRPRQILDAIGSTKVEAIAPPSGRVGVPVECFAASGRVEHVEWCYAADGTLVSFLRGSGTTGWQSLEATTVS